MTLHREIKAVITGVMVIDSKAWFVGVVVSDSKGCPGNAEGGMGTESEMEGGSPGGISFILKSLHIRGLEI